MERGPHQSQYTSAAGQRATGVVLPSGLWPHFGHRPHGTPVCHHPSFGDRQCSLHDFAVSILLWDVREHTRLCVGLESQSRLGLTIAD